MEKRITTDEKLEKKISIAKEITKRAESLRDALIDDWDVYCQITGIKICGIDVAKGSVLDTFIIMCNEFLEKNKTARMKHFEQLNAEYNMCEDEAKKISMLKEMEQCFDHKQ